MLYTGRLRPLSGEYTSSKTEVPRPFGMASLYSLAWRLGLGPAVRSISSGITRYIIGSGVRVSPRGYAALILLTPILSTPPLLAAMLLLHLPLAIAAAASIALPATVSGLLYVYPRVKYRSRGESLEPKILVFEMFLLSAIYSSHNYYEALEKLYRRAKLIGFDVELEYALKNIALHGIDVTEALSKMAEITPSRSLRSLFDGLRGVAESGLGVIEYIEWSIGSHYGDVEARYRSALDSLSMLMEMFMTFAVLTPVLAIIAVITLYGLGGIISAPPINPLYLIGALTFVVSPLTAIVTIILVDTIISRLRP
jgi:archaellum biogenesis protein FlaJ (TadC family)